MKRLFAVLLCLMLAVSLLPQQVFAATTIDKVSLTLAYPEGGKAPPMTATSHGTGYSVHDIEWYDRETDRYLETGDKIQAGHQYVATVWVEAQDGYAFKAANDNTPSISATVNGETVEAEKAYEYKAWAMVTLEYYFEYVPQNGWITSVDLTIPAPVAGAAPFYDKISTASYWVGNVYFGDYTDPKMKNGISWYNTASGEQIDPNTAETFLANTSYEFHCLIFPDENYRIARNAVVRVNGQRAEAYLDYGTFLSVNYTFPATGEAHTHTPSDWRTTGIYHYKACITCGDFLEQDDHKGGVATCAEKGKCTVCGYAYIEENENHTPNTTQWVARADMYHFHKCTLCGAHCDIEDHRWSPTYLYKDASGHAWVCADCKANSTIEKHNPGSAATDTTPQTCKDCGYIIVPAKNHKHELTRVAETAPTCTAPGKAAYYSCSGCSQLFLDESAKEAVSEPELVIPAQGHKMSNDHGFDTQNHWYLCVVCKADMTDTCQAHQLQEGNCGICGYVIGSEITQPTDTTEPTEDTTPQPTQKPQENAPKKNSWLQIVLIALVCFGAAVTASVIILKKKKENSHEENR